MSRKYLPPWQRSTAYIPKDQRWTFESHPPPSVPYPPTRPHAAPVPYYPPPTQPPVYHMPYYPPPTHPVPYTQPQMAPHVNNSYYLSARTQSRYLPRRFPQRSPRYTYTRRFTQRSPRAQTWSHKRRSRSHKRRFSQSRSRSHKRRSRSRQRAQSRSRSHKRDFPQSRSRQRAQSRSRSRSRQRAQSRARQRAQSQDISLNCKWNKKQNLITLYVEQKNNKKIELQIHPHESIAALKKKIQLSAKPSIPAEEQRLFRSNQREKGPNHDEFINNSQPFFKYGIGDEDTIYLGRWRPPVDDEYTIFVVCSDGKTIQLDVAAEDDIGYIKLKLEDIERWPVEEQILNYKEKELKDDDATLAEENVVKGSTLHLSILNLQKFMNLYCDEDGVDVAIATQISTNVANVDIVPTETNVDMVPIQVATQNTNVNIVPTETQSTNVTNVDMVPNQVATQSTNILRLSEIIQGQSIMSLN
eukprot:505363_1